MDGVSATAASAISFSGTTLPRRQAPSPVMRTLHVGVVDAVAQRVRGEPTEHDRVRGTEARAREHRHRELGHHAEVDRDAVTLLDPERLQCVGGTADVVEELAVRDRRESPGSPSQRNATWSPWPASTWRSTQLYEALSWPPMNHFANGRSHSTTRGPRA